MLVHSLSAADTSFRDFTAFAEAMTLPVQAVNRISEERECEGVPFRLAWVKDLPSG